MTNAATNAKTAASNVKVWPQRFGTMTKVQIKQSRKGEYAIITVDCKKFEQTAFAFGTKLVDQIKDAGAGSSVWFKGPVEEVAKTNADGGEYTEDQMKVVYFKNKSAAVDDAPEATQEDNAPVAEAADDLTEVKGVGAGISAKLNDAGVATFTALAAMSDEDLDAISAGTAKRATSGDWRGQAAAMTAEKAAVAAAAEEAAIDEEIPF